MKNDDAHSNNHKKNMDNNDLTIKFTIGGSLSLKRAVANSSAKRVEVFSGEDYKKLKAQFEAGELSKRDFIIARSNLIKNYKDFKPKYIV